MPAFLPVFVVCALVAVGVALLVPGFVVVVAYARFARPGMVFDGEPRRAIVAELRDAPLSSAELARRLGFDRTTVQYHVRVLQRAGYVVLRPMGSRVLVCLPGHVEARGPSLDLEARVEAAVAQAGGVLSRAAVHASLGGVPERTRNHVIRRLVAGGRLQRTFLGHAEALALVEPPRVASPPAIVARRNDARPSASSA